MVTSWCTGSPLELSTAAGGRCVSEQARCRGKNPDSDRAKEMKTRYLTMRAKKMKGRTCCHCIFPVHLSFPAAVMSVAFGALAPETLFSDVSSVETPDFRPI